MVIARRVMSSGVLALALSTVGLSVGLAEGDYSKPKLTFDNPPPSFTPLELPSSLPEVKDLNQFLTFDYYGLKKTRIDTAVSACQYYRAIGAVGPMTPCITGDPSEYVDPITFENWKEDVKIGKHALNGQKEDVAHFINQVDLNLTRDHHMISYGPKQLAGYVCNHEGPKPSAVDTSGLFPTQHEVDALIKTIKNKQTLIACVAMEYSVDVKYDPSLPAPSGTPFTRFWIFLPNGTLTAQVDLDTRERKFVPGVCTACHGGDFSYEVTDATPNHGSYDDTKTPTKHGDLGAHFLPFDMANFAFSSKLSQAAREEAIFNLNTNVYMTESMRAATSATEFGSQSIKQLIEGWYGGAVNVTPSNVNPQFDTTFTPEPWKTAPAPFPDVYRDVVSHSCRTCHAAMDNVPSEVNPNSILQSQFVCGSAIGAAPFTMPNSLVTFDRFWLSHQGQPAGAPDQPMMLSQLFLPTPCPFLP